MPPRQVLRRPPAVARVLERVTATSRATEMFRPGERVVVACSGGPDSLCLLHAMVRLQRLLRVSVTCFHFDHALREGSRADAAYVRRQAAALGVPFVERQAPSRPGRGESVEAWARTVRYEALREVIEELGGGVGAVGHTMDDQAETILMALLNGGGLRALSGMDPVDRPIVRPLLGVTRQETEAFCRSLGLRPRHDPMNQDEARPRVVVRRTILPALERELGRNPREAISRSGRLLRKDADLLQDLAAAEATGVRNGGDEVELDVRRLGGAPLPIRSRVVRLLLYRLGVRAEEAHVEAVLDLAQGRPGRRANLPGGLLAVRTREYVRLSRPSPAP